MFFRVSALVLAVAVCVGISGCVSSGETAEKQRLTEDVGKYSSPPAGIDRPRTGVPMFELTGQGTSKALAEVAADELTTMAINSERFMVIERAQLNQLLKEQGMEGIVKPEELAQSGKVRGVDFLLIGKISNFRVKAEKAKTGFGLANIGIPGGGSLGGFDVNKADSKITAECGVDIRLVNSTTGEAFPAHHSDYKRTDSIGAFGIQILGARANADADLELSEDNKGALLRLALDDAFRGMLPKLDQFLVKRGREKKEADASAGASGAAAGRAAPPEASSTPAAQPAGIAPGDPGSAPAPAPAARKFCANCGKPLQPGVKFCAECGGKVE